MPQRPEKYYCDWALSGVQSRTQMTERHNNRAMCKRNIQKFRAMCHRKIKVLQNLRERWEI